MIHNPPQITSVLRTFAAVRAMPEEAPRLADHLALLLYINIGHQAWDAFLRLYFLYLQSIPADVARAAWGINQASATALNSTPETTQP